MAFKKIAKFGIPIVFPEVGDTFVGVPLKIEHGKTSMGDCDFLHFESQDDEEEHSLALSAGLRGFPWAEWIEDKSLVQITFTGEELSKNFKGKKFKKYEVSVDDGL